MLAEDGGGEDASGTDGGICRIRAAAASQHVPGGTEPGRGKDRDVAQPRWLPGTENQLGFPQHGAELHAARQALPGMLGKAALQTSIPPCPFKDTR